MRQILSDGVKNRVFPGAVALAGNRNGVLFEVAVGSLTYGQDTPLGQPNQALTLDNVFDMASCTKVVATTSAVAVLYQKGALSLEAAVASFLPSFAANGKGPITIENCLLHNAGLPPDPIPNFWDPTFGCAGAPVPDTLNFYCTQRAYEAVMNQQLRPGATIGQEYVYSDLSMLTLMYVVGVVSLKEKYVSAMDFLPQCANTSESQGLLYQCAFEAFVRKWVFAQIGMAHSGYLPPQETWERCVPTTVPTVEKIKRSLQGRVEDGNAYMLGGIAGHAGLFSTVHDLSRFVADLMFQNSLLNKTTVTKFIGQHNHSQGSRALGWNTNDPTALPDGGWAESCGTMSPQTFLHTGFTGTEICGDPTSAFYTVLLTARVYNSSDTSNTTGMHAVRYAFGSAVAAIVASGVQ